MKWEKNIIKREENMKWEKKIFAKKIHKNFKQHPINIKTMTWYTYLLNFEKIQQIMRFRVTVRKLNVMDRRTDGQTDGRTDEQMDMVSLGFKKDKQHTKRTAHRMDGRGGVSISPGPSARREIKTRYKCCAQHTGRLAHYCHVPLAPIHIKSWPKVKLGQVQVGSNIAQNHSSNP